MAASKHSSAMHPQPVWRPTNVDATPMDRYRRHVNAKFNQNLRTSHDLHAWTVAKPQQFWLDVYDYIGMVPSLPAGTTRAYDSSIPMSSVPEWFEGARLNYAENVLVNAERDPDAIALIGIREGQELDGEKVTWGELRERVRVVRSALVRSGVKEGERVAALVSTSIWAVVLFLASASMGAVFTSISPDLGIEVRRCQTRWMRRIGSVDRDLGLCFETTAGDTEPAVCRHGCDVQGPEDVSRSEDREDPGTIEIKA